MNLIFRFRLEEIWKFYVEERFYHRKISKKQNKIRDVEIIKFSEYINIQIFIFLESSFILINQNYNRLNANLLCKIGQIIIFASIILIN